MTIAMTPYTVYETATGKIRRHGVCAESAFARLARAGEAVLRVRADDATHCVVDGAVVNKPPTLAAPIVLNVATLRAAEYPTVQDQLDAIWKGGVEMQAMRMKVAAVKTKYPKPIDTQGK